MRAALTLHFAEERLGFAPISDVAVRDDGSPEAMEAGIDHAKLIWGMLLNGELEVWRLEPESLLRRCDPCLPVNVDMMGIVENLKRTIGSLEEERDRRRSPEGQPPTEGSP